MNIPQTVKTISDNVKRELKELNLPQYKYLVQAFIGRKSSQGIKIGTRFFWDESLDNFASVVYTNESFFCMTIAFGVFQY